MDQYLDLMNQWFILKQEGKTIEAYLKRHKVRSVAIYGMAIYGRHLIRELLNTEIQVKYAIDQKKINPYQGINVVHPEKGLERVDLIINTVLTHKDEVLQTLQKICSIKVIDLDEIVFESYIDNNEKVQCRE